MAEFRAFREPLEGEMEEAVKNAVRAGHVNVNLLLRLLHESLLLTARPASITSDGNTRNETPDSDTFEDLDVASFSYALALTPSPNSLYMLIKLEESGLFNILFKGGYWI